MRSETARLCIIIPVLGRGDVIADLVANIESATDVDHRIVFICSPGDSATEACMRTKKETVVVEWSPGAADFAKKINRAYSEFEHEWYFQGATDLVFGSRWATLALREAALHGVGVVGTNDLGNPYVKRGQHATHIFFSRHYIETHGGTFDGSGLVFSEAYDHQYVDTEFVQTAVSRGQFRPCLRSVVEHMHPHWGKGSMDETYEKATRATHSDQQLFGQRMRRMRTMNARAGTQRIRRRGRR